MELPNQEMVMKLIDNLEQEYDLRARLKRYSTMAPEMIEFAKKEGISSEEAASYALFVGDFIVASSEVPQGTSDDARHSSVIKTFIEGLNSRNASPEALMKTFYVAYELAKIIRKNDLFMAGRGLEREASLVRLFDSFVLSYLKACDRLLGPGKAGWELGVLAAALKRTLPHEEIENYKGAPNNSDFQGLVPWVWKALNEYDLAFDVRVNNNRVISNVDNSETILVLDKNDMVLSLWNFKKKKRNYKEDKDSLSEIVKFTDNADYQDKLIYLRGKLLSSGKDSGNILFIRYPFNKEKPFVLMRTIADEANVTESMSILYAKALQSAGWKKLDKVVVSEKTEVEVESTAEALVEKKKEEVIVTEEEPKSFVGKAKKLLSGIFGSKKSKNVGKQKKTTKRPSTVKKRVAVSKKKEPLLAPFLSEAITVDVVGDLKLFEMFDTYRESQYMIIGVLETDFKEDKTSFITRPGMAQIEKTVSVLKGLDEALEKAINHYFEGEFQLLPEEIVFAHGEDERYIFTLSGNTDRIVGTIAATYVKDITKWRDGEQQNVVQRRTLQMRANQLLSARRHTPLDAAVERIFGEDLSSTSIHTIEGAILKLS